MKVKIVSALPKGSDLNILGLLLCLTTTIALDNVHIHSPRPECSIEEKEKIRSKMGREPACQMNWVKICPKF